MIKRLNHIVVLFFCSALLSCVDEINIGDSSAIEELLVVEGEITTSPGPYTVKLSTTSSVSGLGANELGAGANVRIESDEGEEELLLEIEPGLYQTVNAEFVGKIGTSYRVKIRLANGKEYQSSFEQIPEPVEIARLTSNFIDEQVEEGGIVSRRVGHEVSALLVKGPNTNRYLRFEVEGVFEAEVLFDDIGCGIPEPPFAICYATRDALSSQVRIASDINIVESEYVVDVVTIPVQQKRRYLARVNIQSISEQYFNFWTSVSDQLTKEGSIFDSPVPPIRGNISSLDNTGNAQGYFAAVSVTSSQICIDRSDVVTTVNIPFACNGNCAQIWAPASFEPPSDFSLCE